MQENIVYIKLSEIAEHPENSKIYSKSKPDDVFIHSIIERGILQPLLVCKSDIFEGIEEPYVCIAGHRRKEGAVLAELEEVPCIINEYENAETTIYDLILSNNYRKKSDKEISKEIQVFKKLAKTITKFKQLSGLKPFANSNNLDKRKDMTGKGSVGQVSETEDFKNFYYAAELQELIDNFDQKIDLVQTLSKKLGISERKYKALNAVCDPMYHQELTQKAYDTKGMKAGDLVANQLEDIKTQFEEGEISLNQAYEAVKKIKNQVNSGKIKEVKPAKKAKTGKIYLAGLMTLKDGTMEPGYKEKFAYYAEEINKITGREVINPAEEDTEEWLVGMLIGIDNLLSEDCEEIFMIPGWGPSKGANIEHQIAVNLDYKIYYSLEDL